jgi:hypothetical protein
MAKVYLATKAQADTIIDKVDDLDEKIQPVGLSNVVVNVVDFIHDSITIMSGGLNSAERIIST